MLENVIELKPGETYGDPALLHRNPEVQSLIRRSRTLGFCFSAAMMAVYVGFFALVAFAPTMLGSGNMVFGSNAYMVFFGMFFLAWAFTWLYLRLSARVLEPMATRVRRNVVATISTPVGAR
ncbi:DUF485 domain-containing protein [Rhizobium cauense]|uniref:DUF485 domain-containing protein n=1 Tax=Rhizobium cauense TaxID=1166683 RepID=UPI001C6E903D|nr:DUF485 domain-containing protein [Rhizobium cauense]MBW9116437.1 DUF485 domain-containing protein [Rhizobium cauense]